MDYEKAYKELFGVAKCLHEAGDVITKKQMERLFPQLVESDDEWNWRKVRRAIRGFFTNPIDANELLAWLEKQKECVVNINKTSTNEDEKTRKEILDFIKSFWAEHKESIPRISNWLAYLEKQKEQKKSLSERFRPDFPAVADFIESVDELEKNWSEEDEQWLESIIREYEGRLSVDKDHAAVIQIKIDFLKSLRPQPHWKPSEKQMKALYSALNDANDAISLYSNKVFPLYEEISRKRFDTLESLYNDLKKLM